MNNKTLWEKSNRNFKDDLAFGKDGEQRVINHLRKYRNVKEVKDISNSKAGMVDDIDIEIVYKDGHTSTAEIKTDTMAHRTGNIAYEEFSHKNPGCLARTKANHILYLVENTGDLYVINPYKLRAFVSNVKSDGDYAKKLHVRPSKMGEGASGYLIPIKSIINTDIVEATMKVA